MATRRTQLRRRKKPIQWQIGSAVPFRLVFQFAEYFTERRINDVLGKIVVLNHPGHVQSFNKDRLVLANDLRREFLKRVSSDIADFGVESGHFKSGLPTIVTAPGLARQATLKPLQSLFALNQWSRIFEFFAVAGRGQGLDANIYTDFGFGSPERLNIGFNEDADKIALARISADRQIEDFGVIRKWAAPYNLQSRGLLGQGDLAVSKGEGIGGIARRLAVASGFEFGILRSLLEEIREGGIEIPQRLLQDHRTDFGKKGFPRLLFPLGEFGGCKAIANGFLLLLPGRSAIFQGLIVNIASAAEGFCQLRRLIISRKESIFEGLLDYHRNILPLVDGRSNYYLSWAKRPRYQIHLHPSLRLWMEYSLADLDNFRVGMTPFE